MGDDWPPYWNTGSRRIACFFCLQSEGQTIARGSCDSRRRNPELVRWRSGMLSRGGGRDPGEKKRVGLADPLFVGECPQSSTKWASSPLGASQEGVCSFDGPEGLSKLQKRYSLAKSNRNPGVWKYFVQYSDLSFGDFRRGIGVAPRHLSAIRAKASPWLWAYIWPIFGLKMGYISIPFISFLWTTI